MGEMTKNQKKEALRAWRQKEKKSYCLEKEEVEELFEYLEEALEEEECEVRVNMGIQLLDQNTINKIAAGEVTAKKIADYAEARVIIGRRVLYNVDKIKKYLDAMAV